MTCDCSFRDGERTHHPRCPARKIVDILDNLPSNFFGTVEIGFQNSIPGTVKVTQSYRLDTSRPTSRGAENDFNRK
jgi:hypothetical protein